MPRGLGVGRETRPDGMRIKKRYRRREEVAFGLGCANCSPYSLAVNK